MAKENGGVIGVLNTPSTTTASGVWALQDQYEAKRNGNWPLTPFVSSNSLRFNRGSSDSLSRTFSTATNYKIQTFSAWIKRANISGSTTYRLMGGYNGSASFSSEINFNNDSLRMEFGGSSQYILKTTQLFRDVSAWYHIFVAIDTTQATSSNRIKMYVNGSQITAFDTANYPAQNDNSQLTSANANNYVGAGWSAGEPFDGYMSEVYFIDGQALTPSSFGASNASGVWYPIPYTGSYGTNGFNLKFTNSASLGTDSSPNGNNWTVNNLTSVDQTTDTELNNFDLLNPLDATASTTNLFTQGNTEMIGNNTTNRRYGSTFAINTGKWYCEFKQAGSVSSGGACAGIFDINATTTQSTTFFGLDSNALMIQLQSGSGNVRIYNGSFTTDNYGSSASVGDIIMIALDMVNNFMYVGQNGTWLNGGVPTSGASGTGKINVGTNINYSLSGKTFMFGGGVQNTDYQQWNFGNPSYSANSYADGAGYGNFSYQPPSGYYALCTANLNTYG